MSRLGAVWRDSPRVRLRVWLGVVLVAVLAAGVAVAAATWHYTRGTLGAEYHAPSFAGGATAGFAGLLVGAALIDLLLGRLESLRDAAYPPDEPAGVGEPPLTPAERDRMCRETHELFRRRAEADIACSAAVAERNRLEAVQLRRDLRRDRGY